MQSKYKVRALLLMLFVFGLVIGCKKDDKNDDKATATPRVLPQFSGTSFENKVPDLTSYDPSPSNSLSLADQKTAKKVLSALPLLKAAVGQNSPARTEDQGCKRGEEWQKDGTVSLKVMAKESAGYPSCWIDIYNNAMETLTSKFIPDGMTHLIEGGHYVYKANMQDGDLRYNSLEMSKDNMPSWNVVWSNEPKRLVFFYTYTGSPETNENSSRITLTTYLEGYQKGGDLHLSSFELTDSTSVKTNYTLWEHATYNSASGSFRILEGARLVIDKDATAAIIVVRGNVNKQIAGVRVLAESAGKQGATGALFGTFDATEARTNLALTKNITDSTLDVFDPSKISNSDGSLKSTSELSRLVLERFKALKTVPAMKGSFYE